MTPCGSTSVSIAIGVTTWLDEDSQSPSYSSVFAPGLKSSVPMGLDTYFFSCCGSGTNIATWQNAIAWAVGYSHPTFVEEFAMPRWVQSTYFSSEANAIKGALSCDWEPSYSHNLANFLAAFLPWISSTGATSASMFDPEVLSQCAAVYPDNPNNPTANNVVLQNATTNFLNRSYSAGFYRLSSIIANWSRNSLSGAVLSRGALH
jgi:hypothetical protein